MGELHMRRFFSFWWLCLRTAFWGNAAFANDWQWVFGNPVVSTFAGVVVAAVGAVAPTIAKRLGATEMTTGMPAVDSFLGALAAFILTWLVAYLVRLLNAPVVLFHDQKARADKFDGTATAKKSIPIDKRIAILRERYLSEKPEIQREHLDHLVDGLQAIKDIEAIFKCLTEATDKITKSSQKMTRNNNKAGADFEKRRKNITEFSEDLNFYSDQNHEFTNIIRHITPTLLECTSKFLENVVLATAQDYQALDVFVLQVGQNAKSVNFCIETATVTATSIEKNFKGVSSNLNVAADRAIFILGGLMKAFEEYKGVCEQIVNVGEKKSADGKKEKP
jgi:hypothetical protein